VAGTLREPVCRFHSGQVLPRAYLHHIPHSRPASHDCGGRHQPRRGRDYAQGPHGIQHGGTTVREALSRRLTPVIVSVR